MNANEAKTRFQGRLAQVKKTMRLEHSKSEAEAFYDGMVLAFSEATELIEEMEAEQ